MVGSKTPNIVIQLVWQNKLHVLFPVLLYLKTNLFGSKWRGETSLPHKCHLVIHEYSRYLQPSCCKTGLNMRDITLRRRFSIHFASCTFLLPVLYRSFNAAPKRVQYSCQNYHILHHSCTQAVLYLIFGVEWVTFRLMGVLHSVLTFLTLKLKQSDWLFSLPLTILRRWLFYGCLSLARSSVKQTNMIYVLPIEYHAIPRALKRLTSSPK